MIKFLRKFPFSSLMWITIAALVKPLFVFYLVFSNATQTIITLYGHAAYILIFIFCGMAFGESKKTVPRYGDIIVLSIFMVIIFSLFRRPSFLYGWGSNSIFNFINLMFIISKMILAGCLACFSTAILYHVSTRSTSLHLALKSAFQEFQKQPVLFILYLLPLGVILNFSPDKAIDFTKPGTYFYYLGYLVLFLFGFILACNFFEKYSLAPNEATKPSKLKEPMDKSQVILTGFTSIVYTFTLIFVLLSPIFLFLVWITPLGHQAYNHYAYQAALWSGVIWVLLSFVFILFKKTQSLLIIFLIQLPLLYAIYNAYYLGYVPPIRF